MHNYQLKYLYRYKVDKLISSNCYLHKVEINYHGNYFIKSYLTAKFTCHDFHRVIIYIRINECSLYFFEIKLNVYFRIIQLILATLIYLCHKVGAR